MRTQFTTVRMDLAIPPPLPRKVHPLLANMRDALDFIGRGRLGEGRLIRYREIMRFHYLAANCQANGDPLLRQKLFNCLNIEIFSKIQRLFEKRLPHTNSVDKRLDRMEDQAYSFVIRCQQRLYGPRNSPLDESEDHSLTKLNFLADLVLDPQLGRFLLR